MDVVGTPTAELKPELFACLAELATPVVPDAAAVLGALQRLRADLTARADAHGLTLHAAGSHAVARGEREPLVALERYRRLAETGGPPIQRQLVCGLHVH